MKIRHFCYILLLGCFSCNTYEGIKLSTFHYNKRKANYLIFDRYPEYGDGRKDGCVTMDEISCELKNDKQGHLEGRAFDAFSREPLSAALVIFKTAKSDTIQAVTDTLGQFKAVIPDQLAEVKIYFVGYRTLLVKF